MKRVLRRADYILIGGLILLSLLSLLLLRGGGDRVTVRRNGEVLYSGSLSADTTVVIEGDYRNVAVVEDGRVYMAESDCPGKDCLHQPALSGRGQIACAPNGVIITVTEDRESEVDVVAG